MDGIQIGEIWKDIPGYEGIYQASQLGRIRSVDRFDSIGRSIKGKVLSYAFCGDDYQGVALCSNAKAKTKYIHHLVYFTFFESIPKGMEVCHNDGNKENNNIGNLRLDTRKGNEKDKIAHGTITYGERNGCHKIKEKEVIDIRERYAAGGITMTKLAEEYDVQVSQISRIINRKRWAWL